MSDWRRDTLIDKEYLFNIRLQWRAYRPYRPGWEHDHCEGCLITFAEIGLRPKEDTLQSGYTTCSDYSQGEEYAWVCKECFDLFGGDMGWVAVGSDGG